jgi:hypothetical protein
VAKKLTHESGRVRIKCGHREKVRIGTDPKEHGVNVKGDDHSQGLSVELFNNTDHEGFADPWVQCDGDEEKGDCISSGHVVFTSDGWESVRVEVECYR